jgi:ribonuclease HI
VSTLHVFVDSSTKGADGTRWGESIAAWAAWWQGTTHMTPVRAGVHYYRHSGPNVTFYEGVIRALESCLGLVYNAPGAADDLVLWGDCMPVIGQLRGERAVNLMEKQYRQARYLLDRFNGNVWVEHMNENDADYRKVDQASKKARGWFKQVFAR